METKWTDYATPDPEFEQYYSTIPPMPKLNDPSIPVSMVRSMQPSHENVGNPITTGGVKRSRIDIPVRDGSTISALLYQPEQPRESGSPLIAAYHGGGWCLGSPDSEEVNCMNAVRQFGAVCVSVAYRLAPEHPFPIPVNDAWDSLKWIAENAGHLEADPSQGFIVHGESAGGNLAIVIALLARDKGLCHKLTGISASIPAVLSPEAVPDKDKAEYLSYEQNNDAPGLDSKAMQYLVGNYNPDFSSPLFNCYNWPTGHKDLPPVFFRICGMDPLRDEGLLYERMLRTECGVRTKLIVYPGLPHAFWAMFPGFTKGAAAVEDVVTGLSWLLNCPGF